MKISVIIPVRNEQKNIEHCLDALLVDGSTLPDEILVVDDSSSDETRHVVRSLAVIYPCLVLVVLPPLESEFSEKLRKANGKSRACIAGAELARGNVLVFLDADVRVGPEFITDVGATYETETWPQFWWPRQVTSSIFTKIMAPFIDFWRRVGKNAALGQCFICPANLYRRIKPHACVINHPVEDVAMQHWLNLHGMRITNVDASSNLSCKMFKSDRAAVAGYLRMIYPALQINGLDFWKIIFLHLVLVTFNPKVWFERYKTETPRLSAVIHPVSHLLFLALAVGSWWKYKVQKRVMWKGRKLQVHEV